MTPTAARISEESPYRDRIYVTDPQPFGGRGTAKYSEPKAPLGGLLEVMDQGVADKARP